MQSSLSCDDIGFVPQQARAGCLLFRPFFPTSVAEFMAAPEKKKQQANFQKLESTGNHITVNESFSMTTRVQKLCNREQREWTIHAGYVVATLCKLNHVPAFDTLPPQMCLCKAL